MEAILMESTTTTPSIKFDSSKGTLEISGMSIPENPRAFYQPLFELLNKYENSPSRLTQVKVQLTYFNTASSKCILDVFKRFENIYKEGRSVVINWFYEQEDEDMQLAGENYQAVINTPFFLRPYDAI